MEIKNLYNNNFFGAKFISNSQISKQIPFTPFYKKVNVDFVELKSSEDIDSLKAFVKQDKQSFFGPKILDSIENNNHQKTYKIFALTFQTENLKNLNPEKIIGLCDGFYSWTPKEGTTFFIKHFETKSKNNKYRKIEPNTISLVGLNIKIPIKQKGVGKAILREFIKHNYKKINSIQLQSSPLACSFYKKLGFINDVTDPEYFRLPKENFSKLI